MLKCYSSKGYVCKYFESVKSLNQFVNRNTENFSTMQPFELVLQVYVPFVYFGNQKVNFYQVKEAFFLLKNIA